MIAVALRADAPARASSRDSRRWFPLIAAAAVVDAAALIGLVQAVPHPWQMSNLNFLVLHAIAGLLLCALPQTSASARWVCVAAVLTVPCVGAGIAAVLLGTQGLWTTRVPSRRWPRRRRRTTQASARRLAQGLSACDALARGDAEQRYAVLSRLARRSDPESVVLVRWAAASRDPDLALHAALIMDQIKERAERRWTDAADRQVRRHAAV